MDDLLDLNWSSPPKPPSSSSGNPTSAKPAPARPTPSSFDFLSAAPASSSAAHTSRIPQTSTLAPPRQVGTPNYYATPPLRSGTPLTAPLPSTSTLPSSIPKSASPAPDAFSSLLSISSSSGGGQMSMAEKAKQLEEQKRKQAEKERAQWGNGEFWDRHSNGSGILAPSTAPNRSPVMASTSPQYANLLAPTPKPRAGPPPVDRMGKMGIWDDPAFTGGSSSSSASPTPIPVDELDFDLLDGTSKPKINGTGGASAPRSGMRTPVSDFDFGDAPLDRSESVSPPLARSPPPKSRGKASPPPHVIGQIVEMGFTPSQARQALAKTSDGLNVQEALDMLLQNGNLDDHVEAEWRRKQEEQERRRARRAGPSRDSVRPRERGEREVRDARGREAGGGAEYDKYIAQATELSQNVLSKASSFWTAGKEKALKVYEEQRRAMEAGKQPARDRPRWMEEAGEGGGWKDEPANGPGGWKDDDTPPRPTRERSPPRNTRPPRQNKEEEPYRSVKERADLLFAEEPTSGYRSPARHRKTATPPVSAPVRPPTPKITRRLVDASQSQLSAAASAKAKGNEHFKLGRFAEADSAYTVAISALPEGHLLLVPLWNNRAAAKLKLGEAGPAASDCTAVIELVGIGYHPSKEVPLPPSLAEVKLGDALAKALLKRAQAWEMAEKYRDAMSDYEKLMSLDATFAGAHRNLAVEGARRSRQMLEPKPKPAPRPVASKPPPRTSTPATVGDSTAVRALRKAAAVNDQEDAQRLALKDGVDAKLMAWKAGKETNLRALIASLDTVLWEGIMTGVKVGMHELITEKQVKIRYMKVIARLHPDKLDVKNTTVEQRMLANGVFGALNDA